MAEFCGGKRRIVWRKASQLVPYERNSRTHSEAQIAQIAASIREFGWTNPILIDERSGVIAGHGRLLAAQSMHKPGADDKVPCIVLDGLSEQQKRALVIADNKLAPNAGWDDALLASELSGLLADGYDLGITGFDEDELAGLLGNDRDGLTDPDDVPEAPKEPVTKLGDVWLLGEHRLVCGDSTDAEAVVTLMQGEKAGMVLADPPYGMHLDTDWSDVKGSLKSVGAKHGTTGKSYARVIGDNDDFEPRLIASVFEFFGYCKEIFLWGGDYFAELLPKKNAGSWLVWDKRKESQSEAIGSEFELCWSKAKHKRRMLRHDWFGFLSSSNAAEARNRVHPTQKPTSLLVDMIEQWGDRAKLIVDPYLGSGSTLIACEKAGKACRAVEITPSYVDVAVLRWQEFTGQAATLEGDGRTFAEIADERVPAKEAA